MVCAQISGHFFLTNTGGCVNAEMTFAEISQEERSEAVFYLATQMILDIIHDKFDAKKVSDDKYWLDTIDRAKEEIPYCEDDENKKRHLCASVYTLCNREVVPYLLENILPNTTFSRKTIDMRPIPIKPNMNARDN
jgi:hypothetical protein